MILRPRRQPSHRLPAELPAITLLCPLYDEPLSVGNLVRSIAMIDYPRGLLEVILLIEEADDTTEQGIGSLPHFIRVEKVPKGLVQTKPNALNHGLLRCRGDIIGVYDAEDRPSSDQLLKIASAFDQGGERLGCVQARLNYYNRDDGIITRLFALEYALQFDWFLPGLARLGLPLPLGGTSNFIRREALEATNGWDAFNVTEDADLGMRLDAAGFRIGTVDSTTFEEATDTPGSWIKQRSRWLKGYLQTWVVHLREPASWQRHVVNHFALGAVFISSVINPITWAFFTIWLLTGAAFLDPVFQGWLGQACLMLFVGGTAAHIWFLLIAPLNRGWLDLTATALHLPFYWGCSPWRGTRLSTISWSGLTIGRRRTIRQVTLLTADQNMRERIIVSAFALMALIAAFTGEVIFALRAEADGSHLLGIATGILGLIGCFAFFYRRPWAEGFIPLLAHPAVGVAVFAGWGLPVLAVLLFFVTAQRVETARRPVSVPALGVALLLCALTVPDFGLVALAFASPLFFIAPKAMIDRHMLSFYLVALFPALIAMALGALLFGLPGRGGAVGPELITASLPLSLTPLAISVFLRGMPGWRISAVASVVCAGFLLAPGMSPVLGALMVALAASFLVRNRAPLPFEAAVAAIGTLAAMSSASQVPGL
nr:glycosyltransferase [Parvularcula mediterranea]